MCGIEFTKRNNAARHVTQQHAIKRRDIASGNYVVRIHEVPAVTIELTEGDDAASSNGVAQVGVGPQTTVVFLSCGLSTGLIYSCLFSPSKAQGRR